MNPTCIYCRRTKPRNQFARDHVIPESFGTFGTDTWTLPDCVCAHCNGAMGRKLELFLARDTLEGLMRGEFLPAQASRKERAFRLRRLQVSVPDDAEYGEFRGMIAGYDHKRRMMIPVPQFGWIDADTKKRVHTTEDEFERLVSRGGRPNVLPGSIWVYGPPEVARRLAQRLAALGLTGGPISAWRELKPPERFKNQGGAVFDVTTTVDSTVRRAVAKIALNYVARLKGPDYVLGIPFDGIRSFITTGNPNDLVRVHRGGSILGDIPPDHRIVAHIVTAHTVPDRRVMIAQVTLFDVLTYRILLARGLAGDWGSGHVFDPVNRRVKELERWERRKSRDV